MSNLGPDLPGGGHAGRFDPATIDSATALKQGLAPCPNPHPAGDLHAIVARIAEFYRAMKRDQQGQPAAWLPAGEWAVNTGQETELTAALTENRIEDAARLLAGFWRNDLGVIVKEYASFPQASAPESEPARRLRHNVVRNWLIWRELTREATAELATPMVGEPWGLMLDGTIVAPKACRYHLMAREIAGLTGGTSMPVVLEIGGGYGGMGEFLLRRAPGAAWIDCDLPETAVFAAYFHMAARGAEHVVLYGEGPVPRQRADFRAGTSTILPNFALRGLAPRVADVTVNMFSLSEFGPAPLAAALERIAAVTDGYFLHHNMDRPGVVNKGHARIPASDFAIDPAALRLAMTGFDPFHGPAGDYRWFLYRRAAGP